MGRKIPPRPTAAQKRVLASLKILSAEMPATDAFHPYQIWGLIVQPVPPRRATYQSLLRLGLVGSIADKKHGLLYFLTAAGRRSIEDLEIKVTRDMRDALATLKAGDPSTSVKHTRVYVARKFQRATGIPGIVDIAQREVGPPEIDTASADDIRQKRIF